MYVCQSIFTYPTDRDCSKNYITKRNHLANWLFAHVFYKLLASDVLESNPKQHYGSEIS